MKQIKFRFWNGKRMIQPEKWADVLIKGDGRIFTWIDIAENSGLSEDTNHRLIPMQYTGVKDRNGKEIYEGDIVRSWKVHPKMKENKIHKVYFSEEEAGFRIDTLGTLSRHLANGYSWSVEVIGNIYENKDLLK